VIEAPIFVPFGEDRIAGVVTAPAGRPRGLAILLQGLGAPRSHKYGLWTRIARELADRGIASLRIDYQALGDSTGEFLADLTNPPVEEAVTAARFVMDRLGIEVSATVGNCLGARTALAASARLPGCVSVGCILPGNLEGIMPERDERPGGAVSTSARKYAAKVPHLKRTVRRLRRRYAGPRRSRFVPAFPPAVDSRRVHLLYLGSQEKYQRLGQLLRPLRDRSPGVVSNLSTSLIPAGLITSFRLPISLQPKVIEAVVGWLDETMPGERADSGSEATLAVVAEESAS
jgi:pimeloyl-ACP methyl ester carboxylesterase